MPTNRNSKRTLGLPVGALESIHRARLTLPAWRHPILRRRSGSKLRLVNVRVNMVNLWGGMGGQPSRPSNGYLRSFVSFTSTVSPTFIRTPLSPGQRSHVHLRSSPDRPGLGEVNDIPALESARLRRGRSTGPWQPERRCQNRRRCATVRSELGQGLANDVLIATFPPARVVALQEFNESLARIFGWRDRSETRADLS
jgi:hypothetical protein